MQPPKHSPKKKKTSNTFKVFDLKLIQRFPLVDAMHYIRAFEVGRDPTSSKYEMHVRLITLKNSPCIRSRLRLPHPIKTLRICVIAAPESKAAAEARAEGATLVGEDDVIAQIKEGNMEFDQCICHVDSFPKLAKSQVARILGPKGLMPSPKAGTVVARVGPTVKNMLSASEYREKRGVVRMAVGQLGFTPEQMQANVKAFMDSVKVEIAKMKGKVSKEVHEAVLSSTNAPGFPLTGEFRNADSISPKEISGPL